MDERNYSMDTKDNDNQYRLRVVLIFPQGQWTERNASTREITPREKGKTRREERTCHPPLLAFLAWDDLRARSRFTRSTIPKGK